MRTSTITTNCGEQEGRFFHGYYDCHCYLPLYIFCGRFLLCAKLRPTNIDGAAGAVDEVLAGKLEAKRSDCAPVAGKSTLNRLEHTPKRQAEKYHKIDYDAASLSTWNAPSRNAARSGVPAATLMTRHLLRKTRHTINHGPDRLKATQMPPRPGLIGRI